MIEMLPGHHLTVPLIVELHMEKSWFNIEEDYLEGCLKFKDVSL